MAVHLLAELKNLTAMTVARFNVQTLNSNATIAFSTDLEKITAIYRRSKQIFRAENCVLILYIKLKWFFVCFCAKSHPRHRYIRDVADGICAFVLEVSCTVGNVKTTRRNERNACV
jgi:hypothetical protein